MYNRISIIGGAGTGKTTLSNLLSEKYNIPVTHIDGIHHLKNWQVRDKAERDKIIERAKKEYDAKLAAAESKAQYMLDNDRITKEAKANAAQIIKNAEDEASRLRNAACKFVDDNLKEAEDKLSDSIKSVRQVRAKVADMTAKK